MEHFKTLTYEIKTLVPIKSFRKYAEHSSTEKYEGKLSN